MELFAVLLSEKLVLCILKKSLNELYPAMGILFDVPVAWLVLM